MDLMLAARDGVKLAATRFDATPPFRGALLLNGGTGVPRQFYAAFGSHLAGRGFTVLGINLDDTTDDASEFLRRYGLTYPQLRDGDGADRRDAYGMTGFPESFLVDPEGELALIRRGPVDEQYLADQIAPLIGTRS